jgi:16S rRNA processing protein RimM
VPESRILMGVVGRPHGVRGLVHVTSYAEDLTAYGPLTDPQGRQFVVRWRGEGVAEIAELAGGAELKVADRTAAEKLTNTRLLVDRSQMPEPEDDEFYLADLVGLIARNTGGEELGTVAAVHDYGAGASLEIGRGNAPPLLVPFTRLCVPTVDITAGLLVVAPPQEVEVDTQAQVKAEARAGAETAAGAEPEAEAEAETRKNNTPPPLARGGWGEGAAAVLASPSPPKPLPQGEGACCAGGRA